MRTHKLIFLAGLLLMAGLLAGRATRQALAPVVRPGPAPIAQRPHARPRPAATDQPAPVPTPALTGRPDDEWQGMPIDLAMRPECDQSSRCGLARACVEGQCGPCKEDADCAGGELCVLEHCVAAPAVDCRSRHECDDPEALCVLTGYSSDPRGNRDLRAVCLSEHGGRPREPTPAGDDSAPVLPAPVVPQDLIASARAHLSEAD